VSGTRLEYGVLQHLSSHPDRVVGRDELLRDVWGQQFGGSNVVDAVVKSLRRKLGAHGGAIATVTGHGYRFGARGTES
jgi:DNA-binding response OmpR family regulator